MSAKDAAHPAQPVGLHIADRINRVFRRLLVLTVLLALVLVGLFSYILIGLRPTQNRYQDGARALQLAHAGMVDQETGLRGYLLVNDDVFLQPYRAGVAAIRHEDSILNRTLGADPSTAPGLLDMRVAQQTWASQWAVVVASRRAPTDRAALTQFLLTGKSLFDTYRAKELALSDRVQNRLTTLEQRRGVALVAGLVAVVFFAAILFLELRRKRRTFRADIVDPVADIITATRALADGELDAPVVIHGPGELAQIGESIEQLRGSLVDARARDDLYQHTIEMQAGQLRSILTMSREITGSLNLRYVLRTVASSAATVSGFPRVRVWLADPSNAGLLDLAYDTTGVIDGSTTTEVGIGVVGQCVRYGRPATENDADEASVEVHSDRPICRLTLPLVVGAQIRGAIELDSPEPHAMSGGSLQVLETLATHAAAAIESARLHTATEELANTDALTGLANRRRLDHDLTFECERSGRYKRPLALIMFDVDHFKRFNDTQGHQRGDELLQELATAVEATVRSTDTAYRYGGEEFVILARETDAEHALFLAERVRGRIEEHFADAAAPVTSSFGVGLVDPERPSPSGVIASADAALYRAKAGGRNRVCGPDVPYPTSQPIPQHSR
jgi:diguanylate cyclase (GGDEF)-like protein